MRAREKRFTDHQLSRSRHVSSRLLPAAGATAVTRGCECTINFSLQQPLVEYSACGYHVGLRRNEDFQNAWRLALIMSDSVRYGEY